MYLKQLELIGFKSFAERTRLNFDPGIISVVGPNGCGKTNIVDAVRWVLGEQSAKSLRGRSMEDVIFHGTSDRKGTGMAEVSLTIDNTKMLLPIEYSEVTITRRVFRSGESQYFINKNLCRLKDIDNLFMDTGVGTRAYSVLEQGKMDLILSSKPEDRRFVFEEAAGITKYKEQKRETLNKLEYTENNLIRLNDIIKEVQRQIGSIERSAAKARRYKKIQEELKGLEVKNLVFGLRALQKKYSESEREKSDTEKKTTKAHGFLKEKEVKLREMRSTLGRLNGESIALQDKKLSIETQLVSDQQQSKYKSEKIQELRKRNEDIEKQLELLSGEITNLHPVLQETAGQLDETSTKKVSRREILDKKQKEVQASGLRIQGLNRDIESKREELLGLTVKESQLKNELSHTDLEIKGLTLKERKDVVEANKKKKQLNSLSVQLEKIEGIIKTQREALGDLQQAVKDREEKTVLLKDEIYGLASSIQGKQESLTEKRSQYEIFSAQKRSYEGYTEGVKTVLENMEQFPGITGTVSNIVKVPRKYRIAISAVLGEKAQWIVAASLQNVYQALSCLQGKSISQTVFLVTDMLPDTQSMPEDVLTSDSCIARAIDVVKYDNYYGRLVKYILGRVVIVRDINSARELLEKMEVPATVVTIDGVVLDSEGLVKKGTGEDSVRLINRDSEINELKSRLREDYEEILGLRQKQKIIEEKLKQEEGHLEGASNNMYREEVNLGVLENDFIKQKTAREQMDEEMQALELELEETSREKVEFIRGQKEKQSELNECSKLIQTVSVQLEGLTAQMERLEEKKNNEEREHTELKISLVSVEDRENHLEFKHSQLQTQLEAKQNNIRRIENEKSENGISIAQLDRDVSAAESNVSNLSGERATVEAKLTENRSLCNNLERELSQSEDSLWDERGQRDKLNQELNACQLNLAEIKLKIDNIMQKLQEQYKITQSSIDGIPIDNIPNEELERQILTLRDKLEGMGEVSLVAIEEYESLQQRYEFLSAQQQDLVGAKESLLKAIAKINSTTKRLFWDTFQEMRKNFNEIFCKLFSGGKADLMLIDESDILESGIEIIARPPGKRLQNVSLLSGGEKALTAISLLFAIFKVKPSPFCLLDEIDAPLDDSNIDRFVAILKEFSKTSQFMIVTHNKRTIGASQALYGITMEESGVSKVVSVKLPSTVGSK